MNKFWKKFDNTSYYKKLSWIFYCLFIVIALILFVLGIILLRNMTEGIYERNQEKLSLLTYNIESQLSEAQELNGAIGQNKLIQNMLPKLNDESLTKADINLTQAAIENEMNWLQVNSVNIKNVVVLDNQGEVVSGDLYFDEDQSIPQKIKALSLNDMLGKWYFDENLRDALYIRNLYGTQSTPLKKIGSLVVYFNTSFIQDLLDSSDIFSKEDFILIHYNDQFSATNKAILRDIAKDEKEFKKVDLQSTRYSFQEVAGDEYFKLTKKMSIGNDQIAITYFLLNREMTGKVIGIITSYYLIVVIVLVLSILVVNSFIKRLVSPINLLAENMQKFRGKNDFSEITTNLDLKRDDEIGLLNQSYNQLVAEIEELIKMEYQTKILSQEMEYKFLQSQLNPHFLYNTLNSINWLAIRKGDEDISMMVTSLGTLLRSKLDMKKEYNTIEEELEIIDAYLTIQKLRFKTRLHYQVLVDPAVKQEKIPKLIIQPLIENSIKYGLEQEEEPIHIKLMISQTTEKLLISVEDDGPGFADSPQKQSTGIGLSNIQARLKLLYHGQAKVTINSRPFQQTIIKIELPKKYEENYDAKLQNNGG